MTTALATRGLINLTYRPPEGKVEIMACHSFCKRVFHNPNSPAIPLPVVSSGRFVLAVYAGDKLVATGRIEESSPGWWQLSSLATDDRYRKRYHIGCTVVAKLEEHARAHGARRVTLTASRASGTFYEKRGYTYKYPGTQSRSMYKDL